MVLKIPQEKNVLNMSCEDSNEVSMKGHGICIKSIIIIFYCPSENMDEVYGPE